MRAPRPNVPVTFAEPEAVAAAEIADVPQTRWSARPRFVAAAAALVLIAIACAAPGVSRKFLVLDDHLVTGNTALRSVGGLRASWSQPQRMPQPYPLSLTALWVQYQVFHNNAIGYRTVNLLLHAVNALLLWMLLRRLELPGAWLAAALFAAHPIVVDAVDWVSQQGVLLSAAFCLAASIAYFRCCGLDRSTDNEPEEHKLLYALAALLFAMALLSHVAAVTWPIVVLIALWWKHGRIVQRDVLSIAPFLIAGILAFALVVYFEVHDGNAHGLDFPSLTQRFQLVGIATWFYALTAILPVRTNFAYARWQLAPAAAWQYLPTIAGIAALAGLWIARRRIGRGIFAIAFAYVVLLVPFLGLINFDWMRQAWVADHHQYLALAVLVAGVAAFVASRSGRFSPALSGVLIGGLLVMSTLRALNYRDQEKLWKSVLARDANSAIALNGLGQYALVERKDPVAAMRNFLTVLRIDPDDVAAHKNIARVYLKQGEWTKAIGEYKRALLLRPDDLEARAGLALSYSSQGDDASAMAEYERILSSDPRSALAYNNLGQIFAGRGEGERAIASYRKAIEANPRFVPSRLNLSAILYEQGDIGAALDQVLAAKQIDPLSFEAYFNAASMLGTLGRLDEAEQLYRIAVRLRPESADAWRNLGIVLAKQSKGQPRDRALVYLNEASGCFRRAQKIDPADAQAAQLIRMVESDRAHVAQLPPGARNAPPRTSR